MHWQRAGRQRSAQHQLGTRAAWMARRGCCWSTATRGACRRAVRPVNLERHHMFRAWCMQAARRCNTHIALRVCCLSTCLATRLKVQGLQMNTRAPGAAQEAIDKGWFRTQRSQLQGGVRMAAVLATAREVAAGMAFLHGRGVVHGDLTGGAPSRPAAPLSVSCRP